MSLVKGPKLRIDMVASINENDFETLKEKLVKTMDTLSEIEQRVLGLHFGLDDGKARTPEEICEELGIKRKEFEAIEEAALRKLRHPL